MLKEIQALDVDCSLPRCALSILQDIVASGTYSHPWSLLNVVLQRRLIEVVHAYEALGQHGVAPMSLFTGKYISKKPSEDSIDMNEQSMSDGHDVDMSEFILQNETGQLEYCTLGNPPLQAFNSSSEPAKYTYRYFLEKIIKCNHALSKYTEEDYVKPEFHFVGFDEATAIPSFHAIEFRYALSPPVQKKLVYMLKLLQSFRLSPPWTLQRICALLCAPRRYTDRIWEIITAITGLLRTSSTSPMHPFTSRKLPSVVSLIYARVYREPSSVYKRDHHLNPPAIPDPGLSPQPTHDSEKETYSAEDGDIVQSSKFQANDSRHDDVDGNTGHLGTLFELSRKRSRPSDPLGISSAPPDTEESEEDRLLMQTLSSTTSVDDQHSPNKSPLRFTGALANLSQVYDEDDEEEVTEHTDSLGEEPSAGSEAKPTDNASTKDTSSTGPTLSKDATALISQLLNQPTGSFSYALSGLNKGAPSGTKKKLPLGSKMGLRQIAGVNLQEPPASLVFSMSQDDNNDVDSTDNDIVSKIAEKGESLYLATEK